MRNKIFLGLAFLLLTSGAVAQRVCGSADTYANQIIRDSLFRFNRQNIDSQNERFLMNPSNKRFMTVQVTIPVVIHVVYNTDQQKISEAQIVSQLAVLNDDFASKNADITQVPAPYKPLVTPDMGIRYQLAVRDPNGNATNGIVYKQTAVTSFGSDDAVKYDALGGSDAWPAAEYLNIWVANLSGGLLGYAQFPGGQAATDGVVILHSAFGTVGTATAPFHKGRTATHEIGHYLGLFHIWGDDRNACTGSDNISDTPNQAGPNGNCPNFPKVTCNNGPHGDLFVNYMDYVDDKCMVMFTTEQGLLMRSTLQNIRRDLLISSGLFGVATKLQKNGQLQILNH